MCSSLKNIFFRLLQTQSQKMKSHPLIKSPAVPEDRQWSLDWSMFENCLLCYSCTLDVITMCYVCLCVCVMRHHCSTTTEAAHEKWFQKVGHAHSIIIEPNKMWTLDVLLHWASTQPGSQLWKFPFLYEKFNRLSIADKWNYVSRHHMLLEIWNKPIKVKDILIFNWFALWIAVNVHPQAVFGLFRVFSGFCLSYYFPFFCRTGRNIWQKAKMWIHLNL